MPEPTSSLAEKLVVTLPSPPKEVSRHRASEAWMVTTKKVSKVEIRIKLKAFVSTRIKKFVDIVNSPFFKKSFRQFIFNPPFLCRVLGMLGKSLDNGRKKPLKGIKLSQRPSYRHFQHTLSHGFLHEG
jgi:hypothetical protein